MNDAELFVIIIGLACLITGITGSIILIAGHYLLGASLLWLLPLAVMIITGLLLVGYPAADPVRTKL